MRGRKSIFCEEIKKQALKLAFHGFTHAQLADFFSVNLRTFQRWLNKYPLFCHALKIEKDIADQRVIKSLYKRACGYKYTEKTHERIFNSETNKYELVLVKTVHKTMPPDTTAGIYWSKNRDDKWRDVQDRRWSGTLIVKAEDLYKSRERVLEEIKQEEQNRGEKIAET